MRRVISYILIAFMLCAGVAWAADRHAEAFFGHGTGWSLNTDSQSVTDYGADTTEHCCHSVAHYLGFPMAEFATAFFRENHIPVFDNDAYLSLVLPPLTQPPIDRVS